VARISENHTGVPAQLSSFALEDAPPAAALPISMPGADELQVLTSLEEVRTATNAVATSGQRLISIFTPDMEPALYDQAAFLEIIKRFVLGHSFAKVRVLVRDHSRVSTSSNRFIGMARRCLPSDRRAAGRRWRGRRRCNTPR
jgi:hypothetical protein